MCNKCCTDLIVFLKHITNHSTPMLAKLAPVNSDVRQKHESTSENGTITNISCLVGYRSCDQSCSAISRSLRGVRHGATAAHACTIGGLLGCIGSAIIRYRGLLYYREWLTSASKSRDCVIADFLGGFDHCCFGSVLACFCFRGVRGVMLPNKSLKDDVANRRAL